MRIFSFVALAVLAATPLVAQEQRTSVAVAPPDVQAPPADAQKTPSGLASKVITPGTGKAHPSPADYVTVHYTGWKPDGAMFDSSVLAGKPRTFQLNRVIAGWTEGVQLMVEGEKRRLWIPESLAYKGQREPKGNLVFDVELLSFVSLAAPADVKGPPADAKKIPSGLAYKMIKPGTGTRHPTAASNVTVHYTGWTTDGKLDHARHADFLRTRRCHQRVDRRRAADGAGREGPLLDSAGPRVQRPVGSVRHACVRHRADRFQVA
jgi:peptidylprolyl isomerase